MPKGHLRLALKASHYPLYIYIHIAVRVHVASTNSVTQYITALIPPTSMATNLPDAVYF